MVKDKVLYIIRMVGGAWCEVQRSGRGISFEGWCKKDNTR